MQSKPRIQSTLRARLVVSLHPVDSNIPTLYARKDALHLQKSSGKSLFARRHRAELCESKTWLASSLELRTTPSLLALMENRERTSRSINFPVSMPWLLHKVITS